MFDIAEGDGPLTEPRNFSSGDVKVSFMPNVNRPPSREVAAKALAALMFLEKKFGGRLVRAGLRLGMVNVAKIEISRLEVDGS